MEEYIKYLEGIWQRGWLTNNGPLVTELEQRLQDYLDVPFVQFVSNGTIALQIALKTLNISKEVLTTPFSYVATTNSILWENCKPVFVDIEPKTFCIDATKIEAAITNQTQAILATHVYGYPCQVKEIAQLARKYNLKVIYDAAHAFGVKLNGDSILNYGDISTVSFHATKLFHTGEGGAVITTQPELSEQAFLLKSFGHKGDDYFTVGVNGKNSEMHAAMGLCVLPKVKEIIARRKEISELYDHYLGASRLRFPQKPAGLEYNYAYYPVIFPSEELVIFAKSRLTENNINTRRYFYPSLNKLPFYTGEDCPVSENIASQVLCLPLYYELSDTDVIKICNIINIVLATKSNFNNLTFNSKG